MNSKGAFFIHTETSKEVWSQREGEMRLRVTNEFLPQSPSQAHDWLMSGDVEVINNPFGDPPEAAAEAEAGETIYIRVPAALKRQVEEAAKRESLSRGEKLSGNAWVMRCLERCLRDQA